jgi:hypothetical protein
VWIEVENFLKKSAQKIWILLTRQAYKIVTIFQIFTPQTFIFILHMFSGSFVYYFSNFLLTLQVVNSMFIKFAIYCKLIIKVVDNLIITIIKTIITQKTILLKKSFQLYQQAIIITIFLL